MTRRYPHASGEYWSPEQVRRQGLPLGPPVPPMLAKLVGAPPEAGDFLFEPKWDGFRAIVFRGAHEVLIQSRDLRPLDRYFPELHTALPQALPPGCVIDGEIVIVGSGGSDFDALQLRLHPSASRSMRLARETPASFMAFDVLALDGESLMQTPQSERRQRLERLLAQAPAPVYLTPATRELEIAREWFSQFEGAGLDGIVVKPGDASYEPGRRTMLKVKHAHTADCVVGGFRWYRAAEGAVGSLLLGLYDEAGRLLHVGVTSSFSLPMRRQLVQELSPFRAGDVLATHPWGPAADAGSPGQGPAGSSRWSAGRDLAWEPLRIGLVCEVKYDRLQDHRFRHAATFLRWRPDKPASECRFDQLEIQSAHLPAS